MTRRLIPIAILLWISGCGTWVSQESANNLKVALDRVEEVTTASIPLLESLAAYYPDPNKIGELVIELRKIADASAAASVAAGNLDITDANDVADKIDQVTPLLQAIATQYPQLVPLVALLGFLSVVLRKKPKP